MTLTPSPAAGSFFDGWSGQADCTDGIVTLDSDKTCSARFELLPLWTLTVTLAGNGSGSLTSHPPGIDCGLDCSESYVQGSMVELIPVPEPGDLFSGWGGHADCTDGWVEMDEDKTCTAFFEPPIFADGFESGDVGAWSSAAP